MRLSHESITLLHHLTFGPAIGADFILRHDAGSLLHNRRYQGMSPLSPEPRHRVSNPWCNARTLPSGLDNPFGNSVPMAVSNPMVVRDHPPPATHHLLLHTPWNMFSLALEDGLLIPQHLGIHFRIPILLDQPLGRHHMSKSRSLSEAMDGPRRDFPFNPEEHIPVHNLWNAANILSFLPSMGVVPRSPCNTCWRPRWV